MQVGIDQPRHQQPVVEATDHGIGVALAQFPGRTDGCDAVGFDQHGTVGDDAVPGIHGEEVVGLEKKSGHAGGPAAAQRRRASCWRARESAQRSERSRLSGPVTA